MTIEQLAVVGLLYLCFGSLVSGILIAAGQKGTMQKYVTTSGLMTLFWLPVTFIVLGVGAGLSLRRLFRNES